MESMERNQLPEVKLYAIGPNEAEYAAPLLTSEAVSLIQHSEAVGLALAEAEEPCAAICARLLPENETVLEIISLFVMPEFRRRGLGSTLVLEVLERMMEATDASLRFVTASYLSGDDALTAMLADIGFDVAQDPAVFSWQLPVGKLADSALMKKKAVLSSELSLHPLESLSDYQLRQVMQALKQQDADMISVAQLKEACQQASHVVLDRSGELIACAVFADSGAERVALTQFFTAYKTPDPAMAVLQAAAGVLLEQFSPETVLEIPVLTDSSSKLAKRLLPESCAVYLSRAVLDLTRE